MSSKQVRITFKCAKQTSQNHFQVCQAQIIQNKVIKTKKQIFRKHNKAIYKTVQLLKSEKTDFP